MARTTAIIWIVPIVLCVSVISVLVWVVIPRRRSSTMNDISMSISDILHLCGAPSSVMTYQDHIPYMIYYINLDRSPKRYMFMETQFRQYGIRNYRRITGVDGSSLSNVKNGYVEGLGPFRNTHHLSKSQLGCALSHLKAIKIAYENGLEHVLILEDDTSLGLMPTWKKDLKQTISSLPTWNIVKFGNTMCPDKTKGSEYYTWERHCWGTWAYLINREGMQRILETFVPNGNVVLDITRPKNTFHYWGQIDEILFQSVKTIMYYPTLFFCWALPSTISNGMDIEIARDMLKRVETYSTHIEQSIEPSPPPPLLISNTTNQPLPGIDYILFINLRHRKDRRHEFEAEMEALGIPKSKYERVDAVVGPPDTRALGCLQSHIKCLRLIQTRFPNKRVLVCEDDASFKKENIVRKRLELFMNTHQHNWDVLLLGSNTRQSTTTSERFIHRLQSAQTTSCYLVNTHYVHTLLSLWESSLQHYFITKQWEGDVHCCDQSWKQLQPRGRWFVFHPTLVTQRPSFSDIEQEHKNYGV
jgi:GR25 family glycosyltransferase involved in LPS biosynthesis